MQNRNIELGVTKGTIAVRMHTMETHLAVLEIRGTRDGKEWRQDDDSMPRVNLSEDDIEELIIALVDIREGGGKTNKTTWEDELARI